MQINSTVFRNSSELSGIQGQLPHNLLLLSRQQYDGKVVARLRRHLVVDLEVGGAAKKAQRIGRKELGSRIRDGRCDGDNEQVIKRHAQGLH